MQQVQNSEQPSNSRSFWLAERPECDIRVSRYPALASGSGVVYVAAASAT